MTAKEYLNQYRACCQHYKALLENIEQIESMAEKTVATLDGSRVQSGPGDRVGQKAAILADMRTDAKRQLKELAEKKSEIEGVILTVRDNRQRAVLFNRYILQKPWSEVATIVGYDVRYILKIHGKALKNITIPEKRH